MITERTFNCAVKRSKNYQSVEISQGFKGVMDLEEYLTETTSCIEDCKNIANAEIKKLCAPEQKEVLP